MAQGQCLNLDPMHYRLEAKVFQKYAHEPG
jgi:hypothetical protein